MKIMFLNTWSGRVGDKFYEYIRSNADTTDIFCFEETSQDSHEKLSEILNNFNGYLELENVNLDINTLCGQSIFVSKKHNVKEVAKVETYKTEPNDFGFLFYSELFFDGKRLNLGNVHGKSFPGTKLDDKERLTQTDIILKYFADKPGPKIIGGDFNLMPDTKSIKTFEERGYTNLIKDFGISTTRNKLAWDYFSKKKGNKFYEKQYFSDYVFVNSEIKVKNFEVPDVLISDHNPMILEVKF